MTRVILVRHCEADGNLKQIFQGHSDAEISERGKAQLDLLSIRFRNQKIDAIYSSPLKRAYKTAEAVNQYHHLPITVDPGLMEINGGDWEGVSWSALPQKDPQLFRIWGESPAEFTVKNGESMRQVYQRIWETILKIVAANPGKNVLVTSHGCAIRNFLCKAMGYGIEHLNKVDWCDNTAVSIVDFDEELHPHVCLVNDASHLTGESTVFAQQDWWKANRENECEGGQS